MLRQYPRLIHSESLGMGHGDWNFPEIFPKCFNTTQGDQYMQRVMGFMLLMVFR